MSATGTNTQPLVSITIPLNLTNKNEGQVVRHWGGTAKERAKIERILIQCGHRRKKPFDHPVQLSITRILGPKQRRWDADSILRGNSKQLIDALVAMNWFKDDGPKYIREPVQGFQESNARQDGPAVRIEVYDGRG